MNGEALTVPDSISYVIKALGDAMMVVARYRCAEKRTEWPEDFRAALEELDGHLLAIGASLQSLVQGRALQ